MKRTEFVALVAVVSALSLFSAPLPSVVPAHCAQMEKGGAAPPAVGGREVQEGDLVKLNFTASNEKGEIVRTTDAQVLNDPNLRKASDFLEAVDYVPEDVWVGHSASIPGLGEAVIGMKASEKKTVVLPPDKAYGPMDPAKRKEVPCAKSMPKMIRMSPQDYVGDFHLFPVVGKEVAITPYFKAAVVEVSEQFAVLDCHARDGERFEESFGSVEMKVDQQNVSMILTPRLGSNFPMEGGGQGKIVATDGVTFTVDANNPLAGIPVTVDLEIASVTRAAQLDSLQIQWVEDYDKGIALARERGKPAVLVLYADWCGFCKRLFGETLQDPRVKSFNDRFVWIKVNSDSEAKLKELYAQKGFPLIVILNLEGQPLDRMDGFKDAAAFREELVKTLRPLRISGPLTFRIGLPRL
ncbi:MAG: thioredoxin family protein [Syntrophobacteraceae bacterium]